ncbi:MAG: DNA-directed RNA polymerase subunit beta' [Dehalococcoidia bacterium]
MRSWSYGEVAKPETINYRTLKPEKDGLFDEKIFGPTKDFECYCGKYKRVRYKGIICDKCGVEVTRSKVRRERMGHIELAASVAHIWFVKGTPSRIGLLLDISPRSLERVLYFAQFIVTSVDAEARRRAIAELQEEMEREASAREQQHTERISAIEASYQEEIAQMELQRQEELGRLEEELAQRRSATEGEEALAALAQEFEQSRQQPQQAMEAAVQQRRDAAVAEMEPLRQKMREEREAVRQKYTETIRELEDLKDPVQGDIVTTLAEADYYRLAEHYGHVFSASMGAEAILEILQRLDLDRLRLKLNQEIQQFSGQRRKKAAKRLRVVEAFRKSGNRPGWMILKVLPVLPPDLRPMVQLDGGRFATSDLNDLYRRVINRNNRLKRLMELGAPEIIIRNEKRMLQESVDSLIDNGRRGRAVSGQGNHKLKSLSDMLKGKQGRFRQNLLGKRVDYSGRSVIVVGPELQLYQCGLPRRMALELFKPFVMHALVARGLAHNIKSAKRFVERNRPEVWDILDEVIRDRPVLLNRAPTLHRLGIQAFEPVLIEGSAIQIHPLVCAAFNADFDGDQMAVHVPLSRAAVAEANQVMLSSRNLLLPSNGEPTVAPTLDIVLGCYYMTVMKPGAKGEYEPGLPPRGVFSSFEEAKLAYELGLVELQARIRVRDAKTQDELLETTVGRVLFNEVLDPELGFYNEVMDRKALKDLVARSYRLLGIDRTAKIVNQVKDIGFRYATKSGVTIAINDLRIPPEKEALLAEADARIAESEQEYQMGLITDEERYNQAVAVWTETTDRVQQAMADRLDEYGSVYMMATSGAKGNIQQIRQMAGMRGLMSDPAGRIIDLPIRSSFREGLTVLEYFISTHGARKGLADTALRTADSGYLTRRLVDVSQDVTITEEDCGATAGVWLSEPADKAVLETLADRIVGRWAASPVAHPQTGEVLVERNQEIDEEKATLIQAAGIDRVHVRSPLICQAHRGLCRLCYGRDLALGRLVSLREAVGIIGAQSIGEPGTQLTMRTFHTGGVAGVDITSGLPRVEELFEARVPKGQAIISEIDGIVEILSDGDSRRLRVVSSEVYSDEHELPPGWEVAVQLNRWVEPGTVIARRPAEAKDEGGPEGLPVPAADGEAMVARMAGHVQQQEPQRLTIRYEERDEREYPVPATAHIRVEAGQYVQAGTQLTDGPINPQDILRIQGPEAAQLYLVEEIQKVYRSQGVSLNDKHIEVVVRQMMRRVRVDSPGDTDLLPEELVGRFRFEEINAKILAEGGEPATAQPVLLGITKASLNTGSFLAAASFQETTRVLTEAASNGMVDHLLGLKENVILGKLIPAQAPVELPPPKVTVELRPPLSLFIDEGGDGRAAEAAKDEEEEPFDLMGEAEPQGSLDLGKGEEDEGPEE